MTIQVSRPFHLVVIIFLTLDTGQPAIENLRQENPSYPDLLKFEFEEDLKNFMKGKYSEGFIGSWEKI